MGNVCKQVADVGIRPQKPKSRVIVEHPTGLKDLQFATINKPMVSLALK